MEEMNTRYIRENVAGGNGAISKALKPLATLPSKQGLKPTWRRGHGQRGMMPLATLPSKQGLKLVGINAIGRAAAGPLATLPSKQGLKLNLRALKRPARPTSCYTSIKTRIETESGFYDGTEVFASCYTSIKTRIETEPPLLNGRPMRPLATLPSKQGLKQDRRQAHGTRQNALLLHFHQNKD